MAIRVKHGGNLDAAEARAQKRADRTGKEVEVHYQRVSEKSSPSRGMKYYWAYLTTKYPQKQNPGKLRNWVKADAVRVRRVGGKTIVEIRRKKKRNPPKKRKAKKQASKRKATRQRKTKKKGRR